MQGNWLTKTTHAYVYRHRGRYADDGWTLTMLHGDNPFNGREEFWFPTWELAIRAIPDLWRF